MVENNFLEIKTLIFMSSFALLAWIPASIGKYRSYGMKYLASNRDAKALPDLEPWAARLERAYANLQVNFPPFAVAILLLLITHRTNSDTAIAAIIFSIARVVHFIVYGLGYVKLRATAFAAGIVSTLFLFFRVCS